MRRSPRVLLAWIAAVVVVLLTVRIVTADLGSLHRRAHSLGADISVVVATHDLPLGTTVGATDVRTVRRPSTTVAADVLHEAAQAVGRVVAVALLRDDVVGARHLVGRNAGIVPDGRRAVHVVAKDGFAPPAGSVVDVLATYDPSVADPTGATGAAASPGAAATVVAHGARVVVIPGAPTAGSSTDTADSNDSAGAGVTLLVTEAEARAVAYAASIGEVSLALAPVQAACCSPTAS